MTNAAVIVAAGQGLRMGTPVRKQYLEVDGLPILSHTLQVFGNCPEVNHIFLVVPEAEFTFCRELVLRPVLFHTPLTLVAGGLARQDSVRNGLIAIGDIDGVVAIHDGVRPFVTPEQLAACIDGAKVHGACILGIPATDTLKTVSVDGVISGTLDREGIWLAQTPQVFRYDLIRIAHERAKKTGVVATDDAMLVEKILGTPVHLIRGSRNNMKITTPEDLLLARALFHANRLK